MGLDLPISVNDLILGQLPDLSELIPIRKRIVDGLSNIGDATLDVRLNLYDLFISFNGFCDRLKIMEKKF